MGLSPESNATNAIDAINAIISKKEIEIACIIFKKEIK